ncbi:putative Spermidine/putrescine import ATP-binding protein PotA [Streptomyces aurantiacus JA 4570]|uniref:Putative Spermidine/putrescine import ATP-binding protein PotA n=1 Tax=Streptomyces aurantiacus JA 4570 TaxID=1286094 RepID=S4AXA0_9ACTN|nr:putative Spermidine/putrescine import ATP-binding protein PotA [Streptomyces aurantiacus JA 4570]
MPEDDPAALVTLRDAHVVHKARTGGLFSRDRVYALTGADLTIAAGETVGVVGESGCGKSTPAAASRPSRRSSSGCSGRRPAWSRTAAGTCGRWVPPSAAPRSAPAPP